MRDSIDGSYPPGLKLASTGVVPTLSKKKGKEKARKVDEVEEVTPGAFYVGDDAQMSGVEGETEVESPGIRRPGPSSVKRRRVTGGKGRND